MHLGLQAHGEHFVNLIGWSISWLINEFKTTN
jgi:hypothetical protein